MKKLYLEDLKEKAPVESTFLVSKKEVAKSKAGKAYLSLRLMDRTGEVEARGWDDAEALARNFDKDEVALVKGYVVAYQGKLQINVSRIERVAEGSYSWTDYLPCSERDPGEMEAELDAVIAAIDDRHLRALLDAFFGDADIRRRFCLAPAAKMMHHPYLGGLLEHVLSLCALVDRMKGHYRDINWDLVMTGAILHDIGKIYELSYDRSFGYTDEGRLLGHIAIEMEMLGEKIRSLDGFPDDLALHLKHVVLSHHGTLEFGSPKRPKTPEAILLSYLDDMDAKMAAVDSLIRNDKGAEPDWTSFSRIFERFIYKGRVGGNVVDDNGPSSAGARAGSGPKDEGAGKAGEGAKKAKASADASPKELDLFGAKGSKE